MYVAVPLPEFKFIVHRAKLNMFTSSLYRLIESVTYSRTLVSLRKSFEEKTFHKSAEKGGAR